MMRCSYQAMEKLQTRIAQTDISVCSRCVTRPTVYMKQLQSRALQIVSAEPLGFLLVTTNVKGEMDPKFNLRK